MIRVMIIEDDPMVRDINTKFLKKVEGFELAKAASCLSEAQSFLQTGRCDLILLDIYLPRENGIDFLKWLRKEEINTDVILITADKTVHRVQEAFRLGAVDYLIKPFTFERFKEALIKYKDRHKSFKKMDEIEQKDLDRYVFTNKDMDDEENIADMDLTKGLNPYTYKMIWHEIEKLGDEESTAEELAERLRVARVTVRKYLDYMDKEGKVEKLIEYGKIGRPQHKYKIKSQ